MTFVEQKLAVREKFAYGVGDAAANLVFQTQITFLLFFYTNVLGIASGVAGTILLISRAFDACNDPIIGALADRTRTRWGHYRPWILWTAVPMAIALVLCYTAPQLGPTAKIVWAIATYNILMVVYAARTSFPLRGIRLAVTPDLEQAGTEYWRAYFQMLARSRFNRAHVITPSLNSPYRLERILSQAAADYGVDFTLGIETEVTGQQLTELLTACPTIRSVAIGSRSASREAIFSAVQAAGRRIALDFDGVTTVLDAASEKGVPTIQPSSRWPPSFEISAPVTPGEPDAHAALYWVWGRLGYDPKSRLPKETSAPAYGAAREIALVTSRARPPSPSWR